jgi:hypothetical protein
MLNVALSCYPAMPRGVEEFRNVIETDLYLQSVVFHIRKDGRKYAMEAVDFLVRLE